MFRVTADDAHDTVTVNDLTLVTNLLDGSSDFHKSLRTANHLEAK